MCNYKYQTSYELSLRVGGPIYVIYGLALTAQAVADCDDGFEFLSIEEIREYCPGKILIVCPYGCSISSSMYVCMYAYMYAYMNIDSM